MSDITLNISIKEENSILFKRCIRKLLDTTFIVGDKDERLYAFISRESNRQDISDYLRIMGFDVFVDTNVKIAMLKSHELDEETVGLKRANVLSFTTEQYHLLLVLWEVYLENLGFREENVVMRGDLIDKIKAYEVAVDKAKLFTAMKLFKKYDLIDYDPKEETEDAIITLYPSLQFGWDIAQLQTVTAEYLKSDSMGDDLEAFVETDGEGESVE
ncbi:DUF4194 domain-containing protein [Eubacterium barkeri]|uniref:DUF4194 domain-containing protein n=1 Tax=Eubacterium barkeri TaxID=1528 RepID=A0A1H3ERK8_EUBBA|nr:DUF4194 domain-containing protein [Eubacterium barkeri]SDX81371.1 protein of unknown function [Eubacterium barkeri]